MSSVATLARIVDGVPVAGALATDPEGVVGAAGGSRSAGSVGWGVGGPASPGATSVPTGVTRSALAKPQSSRAAVGFQEPVMLPIWVTTRVRPPRVAAPMKVCCARSVRPGLMPKPPG